MKWQTAIYATSEVYCYMEINEEHALYTYMNLLDNINYCILLTIPIILIIISCVVTSVCIFKSNQGKPNVNVGSIRNAGLKLKRHATVTIILITVVFIAFNVPLLINYILWMITTEAYKWPGPIYSSHAAMYYYSWNFSDVLCMAMNATVNPILLMTRLKRYRTWVCSTTVSQARRTSAFVMNSIIYNVSLFPPSRRESYS